MTPRCSFLANGGPLARAADGGDRPDRLGGACRAAQRGARGGGRRPQRRLGQPALQCDEVHRPRHRPGDRARRLVAAPGRHRGGRQLCWRAAGQPARFDGGRACLWGRCSVRSLRAGRRATDRAHLRDRCGPRRDDRLCPYQAHRRSGLDGPRPRLGDPATVRRGRASGLRRQRALSRAGRAAGRPECGGDRASPSGTARRPGADSSLLLEARRPDPHCSGDCRTRAPDAR